MQVEDLVYFYVVFWAHIQRSTISVVLRVPHQCQHIEKDTIRHMNRIQSYPDLVEEHCILDTTRQGLLQGEINTMAPCPHSLITQFRLNQKEVTEPEYIGCNHLSPLLLSILTINIRSW